MEFAFSITVLCSYNVDSLQNTLGSLNGYFFGIMETLDFKTSLSSETGSVTSRTNLIYVHVVVARALRPAYGSNLG
jgi:hypothetical protein